MVNLDEALADAAKLFEARAARSRELADLADEGAHARDLFHARQAIARARGYREKAKTWSARAREAARGKLLFSDSETSDPEFTREFTDLIIACQQADRVSHRRPWFA